MAKTSSVIVLEQVLVKSKAWLSLSGTAKDVYLLFRTKCQMGKTPGKPKKHEWGILNNGQIVFTYVEAKEKYGITSSRFRRALDELIHKGFMDVAATGMGVHKVETLYAISDRWRDHGTSHFKEVSRPRSTIANPGFKPGNKFWQMSRRKNSSVVNEHGVVRTDVHGDILAVYTNAHGQKVAIRYKRLNDQWLASEIAQNTTMRINDTVL